MHIVRHLRVWISAMCIAGSGTVIAAPVLTPPDPGIDALMQRYDGQVPGAAVLVLHDGRPVFRRGYGLAVLEDRTAVTAQTHFRLASVSKQFTAAAILLLAEDGALTLDDPVKRWLPSLPAPPMPSPCASCSATPAACSTTKT